MKIHVLHALFTLTAAMLVFNVGYAGYIDLRAADIETLDGGPSLALTINERTIWLSTIDGVLNRTRSGFGVNGPGGSDDADGLDGAIVDEKITVTFDAPIRLNAVNVSGLGTTDTGYVLVADTRYPFSQSGTIELFTPIVSNFEVGFVSGNGFSFDGFDFNTPSALLPLPGSASLVLAGILLWRLRQGLLAAILLPALWKSSHQQSS